MAEKQDKVKLIAKNRAARFNYQIDETLEAGIVLTGSEVKSLRQGKANLKDGYARIEGREVFLHEIHISPYSHAGYVQHDPLRVRKLLLHKREIERLTGKTKERGYSLIPTKLYFRDGKVKVELGLGKGKKLYDKREEIKKRDQKREAAAELKKR